MRKSDKVERYLRQLERELGDMPGEQRDRVVAEIKEQIRRGLSEDRSAGAVLRELGSPRLIAMSHVKLRPSAPVAPRSPWHRALPIVTVVIFSIVFQVSMHWLRTHPNRWTRAAPAPARPTADARNLREFDVRTVIIPFGTGRLTLIPGSNDLLTWTCEGAPQVEVLDHALTLNLDHFEVARCEVAVPPGVAVRIHGTNGHLDVKRPRNPLEITLDNGRVSLFPDPGKIYDYDVHVKNGLQDFFKPSAKAGALKVKISVTNGTVKKE